MWCWCSLYEMERKLSPLEIPSEPIFACILILFSMHLLVMLSCILSTSLIATKLPFLLFHYFWGKTFEYSKSIAILLKSIDWKSGNCQIFIHTPYLKSLGTTTMRTSIQLVNLLYKVCNSIIHKPSMSASSLGVFLKRKLYKLFTNFSLTP